MSDACAELAVVLAYWFGELSAPERFSGAPAIDAAIRDRFSDLHAAVAAGECWKHRTTARSALAEVIVLDQFSRHLFRGSAAAFAYDGQALFLAQQLIAVGFDRELSTEERLFAYLPFMHSESAQIHADAQSLFTALGDAEALKYEQIHKDIIDRFGRYPHRNAVLGRASTPEEVAYLANTHEAFFNV